VARLVVTGGSLTQKTEKVPSLSPGLGTFTNNLNTLKKQVKAKKRDKISDSFDLFCVSVI